MENGVNSIGLKDSSFSSLDTLSKIKTNQDGVKSQTKKSESVVKEGHLTVFFKNSFRTLSMPKKDKYEPSKFLGEGVTFKAKLIGILEVPDARGDRMCQEALHELKMAVRVAGEHKQRINIVVTVDGLRLKDEKSGDCLYHHPVQKISFIAQDLTDSRAYGYIFGSPDTNHRFFGIKTDKAATQIVTAMRDLFQVVFELKKREIEIARQTIAQHQLKYSSAYYLNTTSASSPKDSVAGQVVCPAELVTKEEMRNKAQTASVIVDLMDLELELNSLQQGLSQIEGLTPPSNSFNLSGSVPSVIKEDPFGDSFTPPPCITSPPPKMPLPPVSNDTRKFESTLRQGMHWFDGKLPDLFSDDRSSTKSCEVPNRIEEPKRCRSETCSRDLYDIFTDLGPSMIARNRPHTNQNDFFNPVQKEMASEECHPTTTVLAEDSENTFSNYINKYKSTELDTRTSLDDCDFPKCGEDHFNSNQDPFDTDFAAFASLNGQKQSSSDTSSVCHRSPVSHTQQSPPVTDNVSQRYFQSALKSCSNSTRSVYKSLQSVDDLDSPSISSQPNEPFMHRSSSQWGDSAKDNSKQKIVINLSRVLANGDDSDKENDSPIREKTTVWGTRKKTMELESIPEPPPRPIPNAGLSQPPPLPPKKLQLPVTMKPPPRPSTTGSSSHYDYIENYKSVSSKQLKNRDTQIPPLPAPARKPKINHELSGQACRNRPHRLHSQSSVSSIESNYYLIPINKPNNEAATKPPLNITISQLTSTGFEDLATVLKISAPNLAQMTLKELTERLSHLSESDCQKLEEDLNRKGRGEEVQQEHKTVETNVSFDAKFEDHFLSNSAVVSTVEPPPVDKYAAFRELINQEEESRKSKGGEEWEPLAEEQVAVKKTDDDERVEKVSAETEEEVVAMNSPLEDVEGNKQCEEGEKVVKDSKSDENLPVACDKTIGENWATFDTELECEDVIWGKRQSFDEESPTGEELEEDEEEEEGDDEREYEDEDDALVEEEEHEEEEEELWNKLKKDVSHSSDASSDQGSISDDVDVVLPSRYEANSCQMKKKPSHRNYVDCASWEAESARRKILAPHSHKKMVRKTMSATNRKYVNLDEQNELVLLKMMLGKKRLKVLEERLFERYQEHLNDNSPRRETLASQLKNSSSVRKLNNMKTLSFSSLVDPQSGKYNHRDQNDLCCYSIHRTESVDKGHDALSLLRSESGNIAKNRKQLGHDIVSEKQTWGSQKSSGNFSKKASRSRNHSRTSPFEDNFSVAVEDKFGESNLKSVPSSSTTPSKNQFHHATNSRHSDFDNFRFECCSHESSQRQSHPAFDTDFVANGSGSRTKTKSRRANRRGEKEGMDRHYENVDLWKSSSPSESQYRRIKLVPKECHSKYSLRKKIERQDPFNDYRHSKTMSRHSHRSKKQSKNSEYDSGSDSTETAVSPKWRDNLH